MRAPRTSSTDARAKRPGSNCRFRCGPARAGFSTSYSVHTSSATWHNRPATGLSGSRMVGTASASTTNTASLSIGQTARPGRYGVGTTTKLLKSYGLPTHRPPTSPGETVAHFLEDLDLSQAEAARALGLSANRLNEVGRRNPVKRQRIPAGDAVGTARDPSRPRWEPWRERPRLARGRLPRACFRVVHVPGDNLGALAACAYRIICEYKTPRRSRAGWTA